MYHSIEFATDMPVDLEISPKQPLERVLLRCRTKMLAQVRPYVVEMLSGPVEVADLFFDDGTTARGIPFSRFSFTD